MLGGFWTIDPLAIHEQQITGAPFEVQLASSNPKNGIELAQGAQVEEAVEEEDVDAQAR